LEISGEGNWKLVGGKFLTHMYPVVFFFQFFYIENLAIFFQELAKLHPRKKKILISNFFLWKDDKIFPQAKILVLTK
jgi:hypothetical protein